MNLEEKSLAMHILPKTSIHSFSSILHKYYILIIHNRDIEKRARLYVALKTSNMGRNNHKHIDNYNLEPLEIVPF